MKRINANPALKNAYETLVKDLPSDVVPAYDGMTIMLEI